METKLLFSIVVPVYNVEQYLDKCLQSLTHQTFKNFEVILVDDGSTDSSGNICDKYAENWKPEAERLWNEREEKTCSMAK